MPGIALGLGLSLAALGELDPAAFELPAGLRVELWAESPRLFNPTCMDVDARGRVWVAEAVNYRKWEGRNPGLEHEGGDRVVILEDVDGDGRCDRSTVFAQDAELVAPMGLAVLDRRVFVSSSPRLLVFTDDDGDDRADRKEVFLEGFGGPDHDHGLHSVVAGPDGRLYLSAGNAGPHRVTDRDGWSLRAGALYVGGGAEAAPNEPGLASDDGRVWTGGLVLRVDPDGGGLRPLAHNFRNHYEVAVDSFGDLWTRDNDDDGSRACRTVWVMEGGNHGYFSAGGSRFWTADRRPGQEVVRAHWHSDDPGVVPPGTIDGAGGPTGVCVYEGELLPARFRGAVLGADAGRNVVFAHRPRPAGAGFELERDVLIAAKVDADDGGPRGSGRWFRPSDVAVGLAGEVFVADWYDAGVGGHGMADRAGYGRILRILPERVRGRAAAVELDSAEGRARALECPAPSVRHAAVERVLADPAEAQQAGRRLAARTDDAIARARGAWLLARSGAAGRAEAEALLADPDPRVAVVALRALRATGTDVLALAHRRRLDPVALWRELAVDLRDASWAESRSLLSAMCERYDGSDRWLLEAIGLAAEGKEAELWALVRERLAGSDAAPPVAYGDLLWRLHPVEAVGELEERARAESTSAARRPQAVDALAFVPERAAAEAMVRLALDGPADVRDRAFWWVTHRSTNDWAEHGVGDALGLGERDPADAAFTSEWLRSGSTPVDVDVRGAELLALVVDEGAEGNGWDWADWLDARLVGPDGEVPLGELDWVLAEAGWGHVDVDRNCVGGPLVVDGVRYERGLGTHAPSRILYRLPDGHRFERFVARAGVDDEGATQDGARTRLRLRVHVEGARREAARLRALAEPLRTAPETDAARQAGAAAARELALDPRGALLLVRMAEEGELDPAWTDAIAADVYRNPDFGVRALASRHFARPGAAAELPPLDKLARRTGDPEAGRAVFFGERAGCATCHAFDGAGGAVGPDLTRIRDKYGRRQLLDSILSPSAEIVMGYETWTLETDDGLVWSGRIESEGASVVVLDSTGERHVLDSAEVVFRKRHTTSLMPDNAALGLSVRELVDLAELLLTADVATGPGAER